MKTQAKPVRTTILYGLFCALAFVPLSLSFAPLLYWSGTFNLTVWMFLAGYAGLLCRWGEKRLAGVFLPMALLLATVFWNLPVSVFLLLSLGVLSWIRSSICFPKPFLGMFVAELLLCLGGATLVAAFSPHSSGSLAIGIFLFALIQSLYFVVFVTQKKNEETIRMDPFDVAMRKGTQIMANGPE